MIEKSEDLKKELVAELKKQGLDLAEESVAGLVKTAFAILPKLGGLIKNEKAKMIYSLVITPVVAMESQVLAWVDKIDGEDDPEL